MVSPECARPASNRVIRRIPRRPVLLGLTAVAVAVPAGSLLAGCGRGEPDPLEAVAARARSDAALIDSILAQPTLGAALSGRLGPVADARRQHAVALGVELGETSPAPAPPPPDPPPDQSSQPSSGPDSGSGVSSRPSPDDVLPRVRTALDDSVHQAGRLVLTLPRQRAALVASIAACCAAYRAVLE